jgi:hypothetical protein
MGAVVDATYERPQSEEGGVSPRSDPLTELLRLVEPCNPPGPESSSAGASVPATARARSGGPPHVSAPLGERALPFRPTRGSELRLRPGTSSPYSNPLARGAIARSPRQEDVAAMQARESAPRGPSAVRAHLRPAHQTYRETAAEDDPSSNVSHPADKNSILRQPRAPRRLGLAIGGIAGSVFIGTLGAVGYYALSASNTGPRAPQIADNAPQATAADQGASGEVLNQQPANTSWGDQPRKVRTVSIRRVPKVRTRRQVNPLRMRSPSQTLLLRKVLARMRASVPKLQPRARRQHQSFGLG